MAQLTSISALSPSDLRAPQSLEAQVTDVLREAIIGRRIEDSEDLRIHDVASQLNVSVTPVANALRRLAVEGYVTIAPRRGFRIIPLSLDDLEVLVVQRVAVERFAIEKSMPNLHRDDFVRAARIIQQMDRLLQVRRDYSVEMFKLDQRFHLRIYGAAGRASLIETITRLRDRARAYMHLASTQVMSHMHESNHAHEELLAACQRHDLAMAQALIEAHIVHLLDVLHPVLGGDARA